MVTGVNWGEGSSGPPAQDLGRRERSSFTREENRGVGEEGKEKGWVGGGETGRGKRKIKDGSFLFYKKEKNKKKK